MKRIVALIAALIPLAFFVGRRSESRNSTIQPIVVTPPDMHIYADSSQQAKKPEGRLERHRLLVDPYILLVVTLISVMLSGAFAGLTWKVNQSQEALMRRQTEIQASQALPIFTVELTQERGPEGKIVTEWLELNNEGGIARSVEARVYARVSFTWDAGDRIREGWFFHVLEGRHRPNNVGQYLDGSEVVWGSPNNVRNYDLAIDRISRRLIERYGVHNVRSYMLETISINYVDYQGNPREEFYNLLRQSRADGEVIDLEVSPAPNESAQQFVRAHNDLFWEGAVIFLQKEGTDDQVIEQIASRVYQRTYLDDPATPVPQSS